MSHSGSVTPRPEPPSQDYGRVVPFRKLMLRSAIALVTSAAAVYLLSWMMPGFEAHGDGKAFMFALLVGVLNTILVPLITRFAFPLIVYTAGLVTLLLNTGVVLFVGEAIADVRVDSVGTAFLVSLGITAINMLFAWLLAINDDITFNRLVTLREARKRGTVEETTEPGVIFLEIDGLAEPVFRRAIRNGHMPNLARWVITGTHRILPWECGLSSQTGASQAGLLQGSNEGIVAFRWYERDTGKVMVSSAPKDAAELERRLSNGHGLLSGGGASRNNLLSGDAVDSLMTLSRVLHKGGAGKAYSSFFSAPYNVIRTLVLMLVDIGSEMRTGRRAGRRNIYPRLDHKGWKYPLVRVATTVVMRDLTINVLVGDLMRGVPTAYATFVGYDEVAHHDGVERAPALEQLRQLDAAFARLERAARLAPRPYEFVILSDHGQSQGATFLMRYGITLEDLVRSNLGEGANVIGMLEDLDSAGQVSGAMTEVAAGDGALSRVGRTVVTRDEDGAVIMNAEGAPAVRPEVTKSDTLVMASGNLGLVYFTGSSTRMTLEQLDAQHPNLVSGVAGHEGVSFVLVRSEEYGTVAIGGDGRHYLEDGRIEGVDPLVPFGPLTPEKIRRHDRFENMPDLLVISMYDQQTDEVAAFEELIGSHGGIGGEQSHAFALYPASWKVPDTQILGAEEMHVVLKHWIADAAPSGPTAREMAGTGAGIV